MHKTILAFGELLWDLLPSGPVLGGAPANFAYRIHSAGDRSVLVSRLGHDALGQAAFAQVSQLGLDASWLQWDDEHPTGTVQVQVDAQGNPHFHIVPGVAYDHIGLSAELLSLATTAHCLCFGTLVQRTETSRRTLQRLLEAASQAIKLCDLNLRPACYSPETIAASLEHADILKLNEQECDYLASLFHLPRQSLDHFASEAVRRWDLTHCLITLGERGALAVSRTGEKVYSAGYRVPVMDTCGSGDACSAAFLHHLLQGAPLGRAVEAGNAWGALVATQRGATELISAAGVEEFLRSAPPRMVDRDLAQWSVPPAA